MCEILVPLRNFHRAGLKGEEFVGAQTQVAGGIQEELPEIQDSKEASKEETGLSPSLHSICDRCKIQTQQDGHGEHDYRAHTVGTKESADEGNHFEGVPIGQAYEVFSKDFNIFAVPAEIRTPCQAVEE